jgi:glycosyltransferase involved in cell wall biosynthesis
MKDEIASLGISTDKVNIINFGIDTQRFSAKGKSSTIRNDLNIGDAQAVISLRNFEPVYDIPTLLRAIPLVHQTNPDVHIVIVGRGTLESELKAIAKELELDDRVHFLGYIPNQELPDYISSMDIYVSTSLSDAGIAASTAEAMACELPVVITNSGENEKWISNESNGFIFPVGDSNALASCISRLLSNEKLRSQFGQAGRETILERNDYYQEMKKTGMFYKQITNN